MKKVILFLMPLFLAATAFSADEWRMVRQGETVRFPESFYFQPDYRVQWWYFTGHLFDETGREFGYELSLFAAGVQHRAFSSKFGVSSIFLSHTAVTDVQGKQFLHAGHADSGAYGFSGASKQELKVWVDSESLEGLPDRMHIKGATGTSSFDLVLLPRKPIVLNGVDGYSRKSEESPEIASLYFSFTDLETRGSLRIGPAEFRVTGTSWFDRELFSQWLGSDEAGWDWFALQLDDGRQIMLYQLRKKNGSVDAFSSGTIVYKDGSYRHLGVTDFSIEPTSSYRSKHTGVRYPSSWRIEIPSEKVRMSVIPLLQDQEFLSPGLTGGVYWEGTCRIEGSSSGRAYVELTGY